MNLSGGTAHDADSKIWHEVMAGKIQHAVSTLPAHLQAWGHLCFSPDNIRNPRGFPDIKSTGVFQVVQNQIWDEFIATDSYEPLKSVQQSIVLRYAVENTMHLEQHGAMSEDYNEKMRPLYSQNYVMSMIARSKNDWRREGYRDVWAIISAALHDWTGHALAPIAVVMSDFEEKRELAYE